MKKLYSLIKELVMFNQVGLFKTVISFKINHIIVKSYFKPYVIRLEIRFHIIRYDFFK